jgi:norsolorinic acid ketoreductase
MVDADRSLRRRKPPVPNTAYGPSKAAIACYGVRLNSEEEWLNTFVIGPGWVQTDMGNTTANLWGIPAAPTTEEDSGNDIFNLVTTGTKEK